MQARGLVVPPIQRSLFAMMVRAIAVNLLLVAGALAAPASRDRLDDRIARRRAGSHFSKPRQHSDGLTAAAGNSSHADSDSTWCGAILIASKVRPFFEMIPLVAGTNFV